MFVFKYIYMVKSPVFKFNTRLPLRFLPEIEFRFINLAPHSKARLQMFISTYFFADLLESIYMTDILTHQPLDVCMCHPVYYTKLISELGIYFCVFVLIEFCNTYFI